MSVHKIMLIVSSIYLLTSPLMADSEEKEPPKIGNFALPSSQIPSPLLSLGQNILEKNKTQVYFYADDFVGKNKHNVDLVPSILYGMTDDFSVYFNVPIAASFKDSKNHSSGLQDMFLQFEYAFYADKTSDYSEQATILTNVTFPTGSVKKTPSTGFGASSFLLGATYSRMYVDWFGFASPGVILTTSHEGTKIGNQFLYQAGFGRNILTIGCDWLFAWMIEIDGQYTKKSKIRGMTDSDSGGNVVYITPSLWISSKKMIVQLGVGFPATQHLNGNQKRNEYLLAASVGWTF